MMATSLVYNALSPIIFPQFHRRTTVTGAEQLPSSGGYILAPNHVDWLDGFYISAALQKYRQTKTYFLAKSNTYWWTGMIIHIPRERRRIIDNAAESLKRGLVVCNFPEGQRNADSKLLSGKTGTVRIAADAGVPVIPVGITCESGRNMGQSLRYLFSSQYQVRITFGSPLNFSIPPGGISEKWLRDETDRLMKAIAPLAHKSV